MKRLNRKGLLCAAVALAALCVLTGCQKKDTLPKPDLPLEDAVITDTLEQVDLNWVISEDETYSSMEGHICYTLRDPEKGYPGGGPDSRLLYGAVNTAVIDGERYLSMTLPPDAAANFDREEARPFDWADWEKPLQLAARLYGGFEDENELFEALSKEELDPAEERFRWEEKLTGGYCRVGVVHSTYPFDRYTMFVTIYESKAMCEKMDAQAEQKRQELLEMQKEAMEENGSASSVG